jgi:hypothetical protein
LLAGLLLFNKLQPPVLQLLVFLLLATVINEGFSFFGFYKDWKINKAYMYIAFFILQSLVFWALFYQPLAKVKHRQILNYCSSIIIALQVVALVKYGAGKFNPWFLNLTCLHMIFIGSLYFNFIYSGPKITDAFKGPFFWLSAGIIFVNFIHLFFVNATLIKAFSDNPSSALVFKYLNTFGNVVYYSLIIYAFICSSKSQKRVIT